jgi:hypothetical protein
MSVELSFFGSDIAMLGIFAFLVGMSVVTVYTKLKDTFVKRRYSADDAIVEAVVLEYTRRLRDYDKVIAELRAKVDIIESRTQLDLASQQASQLEPHVAPVARPVTITQHATIEREGNGTTHYILKLLSERPRTSREVQWAIGRTREHTARLMKKLHESHIVSRDINTKPFRYSITDAGREMLKERSGTASVVV